MSDRTKGGPGPGPDRRTILKAGLVTVVAGTLGFGCDGDGGDPGGDGGLGDAGRDPNSWEASSTADMARVFPQAFCSGDPTASSVILWTRAVGADGAPVSVDYQVSIDEAFAELTAEGTESVTADSDHTLRLKLTELGAGGTYFYRFRANGVATDIGRTRTAPAADDDTPVRFAFASCQDYNGRYYHAWRGLVEQSEDLDFVLFLGDYIYETARDERFQEEDGRGVVLPDGLSLGEGRGEAALTIDDYRALYQQYRSDPDLQAIHKRVPFISIWDDHEFADDSWQDHATHFNEKEGDEQDTARRTAASQAWYEYQAADVTYDADASFPDDLQIYRKLRWGQHLEVVLTDQRSYRDDHLIPEGPADAEVGKFTPNTSLGSRQFLLKDVFDVREAAALPSMLGAAQKAWFVESMTTSTATWKFWGSETMLAQLAVDLSPFESVPATYRDLFYLTVDQWDGYRSERAEVLTAIAGVDNVVVLTGDIHSFHAAHLRPDFDAEGEATAVEFVTAGISSRSFKEIISSIVGGDPVLSTLGLEPIVDDMDQLETETNPHVVMAQNQGYGFGLVELSAAQAAVTFYELSSESVRDPAFSGGVTVAARFTVAAGSNSIVRG